MDKFVSTLSTFDMNPLSLSMNSQRYVDEVEVKMSETSAKIGIPRTKDGNYCFTMLTTCLTICQSISVGSRWTFCTYKIFIICTRLIIVYFTNCKEI